MLAVAWVACKDDDTDAHTDTVATDSDSGDTGGTDTDDTGETDTSDIDTDTGDTSETGDTSDTDTSDTGDTSDTDTSDSGDTSDSDTGDTDPPPCDADGDGHDRTGCAGDDCDDADATAYPGAPDVPDRADDDCDGTVDRGVASAIALYATSGPQVDERITSIDNLVSGDLDGDGTPEIVVGAPFHDVDEGRVYVLDGAGVATWTGDVTADAFLVIDAETAGDNFGYVSNALGDLDGDAIVDLAIGARYGDDGGRTYVFPGGAWTGTVGAASADVIVRGAAAGGYAGWGVDGAGDLDGDGLADLAIGDIGTGDGTVGVFLGLPATGALLSDADVLWSGSAGARLGEMVTSGDLDSDGYDEVLVGAPGTSSLDGAVLVFAGAGTPASGDATAEVDWTVTGVGGGEVGGNSRGSGRPVDLDGSGGNDLVIADYLGASTVYVLLDPASGAYLTSDGDVWVEEPGIGLGSSVHSGDVDGDGQPDLVIGAIYDSSVYGYGGSVTIVWGGGTRFYSGARYDRATADAGIDAASADQYVGTATSLPGDLSGDGDPDLLVGASWDAALATRGGTVYLIP